MGTAGRDGITHERLAQIARTRPTEMIGYRVYFKDSDGHIVRRIDLTCRDDEIAKEQAKKLVDGHDVELWQQHRRICEFKAPKE